MATSKNESIVPRKETGAGITAGDGRLEWKKRVQKRVRHRVKPFS